MWIVRLALRRRLYIRGGRSASADNGSDRAHLPAGLGKVPANGQ